LNDEAGHTAMPAVFDRCADARSPSAIAAPCTRNPLTVPSIDPTWSPPHRPRSRGRAAMLGRWAAVPVATGMAWGTAAHAAESVAGERAAESAAATATAAVEAGPAASAPGASGPATVAAGAAIAKAGAPGGVLACAACHGAEGHGTPAFPRLAGSGADYLQAQLDAFAAGTRQSPVMQPFAQHLDATQRQSLAMYYASLTPPTTKTPAAADPKDAGAWLAQRGDWAANVPACAQCHGPGGVGVGGHFPPLAGLPASYLQAQLQAWKDGSRPPGPQSLMGTIAQRLDDGQMQAVAAYYASLSPVTAPAPAAPPSPAGSAASSGGQP